MSASRRERAIAPLLAGQAMTQINVARHWRGNRTRVQGPSSMEYRSWNKLPISGTG